LTPGIYFRALLIGYFEGIGAERGIAWRLGGLASAAALCGHRAGRVQAGPLDDFAHAATDRSGHASRVFACVLGALADRGLLKGQRIAIDATTLEANAAMRSIVRRDTGESYEDFLRGLAKASGMETPTREDLARLDRKRKKRMSNQEWKSPADGNARIAKMKDGRTHLAHRADHAVDLDKGAVVRSRCRAAIRATRPRWMRRCARPGWQWRSRLGARRSCGSTKHRE
jgi:transposase